MMWNGFTQGWVENGEAKLLIQSYLKSAAVLNINQTLAAAGPVYEERFTFDRDSAQVILQRTNVVYKFRDKFLLSRAPERMKGLEDYNMSFQWLDYESDQIDDVVYGMNLGLVPVIPLYIAGGMGLNPKGDKLCCACRFLPAFSILNLETGEALQVFPEEEPDMQAIIDAQKDASYYGDVTSTERYVYLASSRGVAHTELEKKGTAIEVYDWEGRAVCRFLVSDVIL